MRSAGVFLTLVVVPSLGQAPAERQLKLPPPTAQLSEEFTFISSLRELSDGRVLITDPRDNRVVVVDLNTGAVQQVGRQGKGPNEYSTPGLLIPLAGDSSLMNDILARRWLLFAGPTIVATLPPDAPIIKAVKNFARGADGRGNVWFSISPREFVQESAKPGSMDFGPADSTLVARANRATLKLDTVAKLRGTVSRQTVRANADGKFAGVSWSTAPLSVPEAAALFSDGWFAIARLDPYRVDWISPDGKVSRGRPIAVTPIKVSSAEKEAYFARQAAARAPRPGGQPLPEAMLRDIDALRDQFPEVFPPFSTVYLAAGDGTLWLRRPVSMNFLDSRYDVVDRSGVLLGVVSLAKGERVITVSKSAVYVVWKDADDLEYLRRHPLPYGRAGFP